MPTKCTRFDLPWFLQTHSTENIKKIGQGQTLVITARGVDSEVCFRWEKLEQLWCLLRRARVGVTTHTSREGEELGESEARPEIGQSCYWGALNTLVAMGERDQWRYRKVNVFCLVAARENELFAKIKKKKEGKQEIMMLFKLGGFQTTASFIHMWGRRVSVSTGLIGWSLGTFQWRGELLLAPVLSKWLWLQPCWLAKRPDM